MNARSKAISVGLFVVITLVLLVTMLLSVSSGSLFNDDQSRYELVYDTSIKGLEVGAPVTLRGVRVGEVASITTRFYQDSIEPLNSVVIDINPERIEVDSNGTSQERSESDLLDVLLAKGLSAKLRSQSLLTGLLYIEVDFYKTEPRMFEVKTKYRQLQTVPSDLEFLDKELGDIDISVLAEDMQQILTNLNKFTGSSDFQTVAVNLNHALKTVEDAGANAAAASDELKLLARDVRMQLNLMSADFSETLAEAKVSVREVGDVAETANAHLAPDSPLVYDLTKTMNGINRAAIAVEQLVNMLEQQPNSILLGKRGVK